MFAEQHFEDAFVDQVVLSPVGHHPHLVGLLAEPVNPSFPLFQAGGVPRQVVVNNRVAVSLQVDPLAQTVRGDENRAVMLQAVRTRGLAVRRGVTGRW